MSAKSKRGSGGAPKRNESRQTVGLLTWALAGKGAWRAKDYAIYSASNGEWSAWHYYAMGARRMCRVWAPGGLSRFENARAAMQGCDRHLRSQGEAWGPTDTKLTAKPSESPTA